MRRTQARSKTTVVQHGENHTPREKTDCDRIQHGQRKNAHAGRKKKTYCGGCAVYDRVEYIKVTIVTLSVTNRHIPITPPYYVRGLMGCVIGNYSVGTATAAAGVAV
jgi:hypothetical protein